MILDVCKIRVDPQPTAVVRRTAAQSQLSTVVPQACGEVWKFLRTTGLPNSGLNMALYHDAVMNIECGVVVPQRFTGSGDVVCSETPGGTVATVSYFGPYSGLGEAYDAIGDWCAANGYAAGFPCWEVYGHWEDDPSKLRTDVFFLLSGE
jgi:effector-binding domain-containing protein